MGRFAYVNNIRLHYLDHAGGGPTLVLLPGLTANSHSFDGLILAGLSFRALALDLRGRGLSDKPAILLHATGAYAPAGTPPIVTLEQARATCDALPECRYIEVPGNHFTMLYGAGARRIVESITEFVRED